MHFTLPLRIVLPVLAVGVLGVACSSQRGHRPAARAERREGPVIVHVASRHEVITVTSSPDGPRYSARTKSGALLAQNLTLSELRDRRPGLYRQVHPTVAARADGLEADASLDTPAALGRGAAGQSDRGQAHAAPHAFGPIADEEQFHADR